MPSQTVAVLGASPNPERYSNKAIHMLLESGHTVIPVSPRHDAIEGIEVKHHLSEIDVPVDTLTVYVGPAHIQSLIEAIVALQPGRVVLNPGTEDSTLKLRLDEAGIPHLEACTLVLLRTGQF